MESDLTFYQVAHNFQNMVAVFFFFYMWTSVLIKKTRLNMLQGLSCK